MVNGNCPITMAAKILGRKWTLEMIYNLQERKRFCELQEIVGGVNPATLTHRLKTLESSGIVNRCPISESPRHVEYELTEKGKDLVSVMSALTTWVNRWYPEEENGNRQP
jgi:DNA-binding HxlR family transcriptional regulator